MSKDNYCKNISMKGEPSDNGSKVLQKGNECSQFKNLCVGHKYEF